MVAFMDFLTWVGTNILGQPAVLLGIVAFVGLILQKKPFSETLIGTAKVMIGVVMMLAGAGLFVDELVNFQSLITAATGVSPKYPPNYVPLNDLIAQYGSYAAVIMTVAFILHLILVRIIPRFRHVYLTGHLMWWVSLLVVAVILTMNPNASAREIIGIGAIVMAIYWTIQPAYIHHAMRDVIGSDAIGYAHTSSLVALISYHVGKYIGKPEESTEEIKLPKSLSFLKDYAVSTAVILGLIMVVAAIMGYVKAPETVANLAGDLNPIIWAVLRGVYFAAAIVVLLTGVKMFVGEIVPAFKGISEKVIPGAIPAVDAPVVFPYAPTAVIIGFLSGLGVFLVMMGLFIAIGFAVIVPPMIMLFFPGGAAAVFGNKTGGWKGAVFAGALNGLILAIGQAVTLQFLTYGTELATLGDPDWYAIVGILKGILAAIF
ncbi:PTS ascorbate transporter subunit IIC [Thermococcus sp. EP1]|uniref:PTS ascorbate transporter subunit IIC n=1 Tax=Thermococcus sp. EP1 TaxID=1591054 RepID=UPI0006DD1A19|nr:PTS ascorbate transporter subunit IIC [Thermococcus sp. EP1]